MKPRASATMPATPGPYARTPTPRDRHDDAQPPCDDPCEHRAECMAKFLACEVYARYTHSRRAGRPLTREPSREIFERIEGGV